MWDVKLESEAEYRHTIPTGFSLVSLTVRGSGVWKDEQNDQVRLFY
jgi:quercetin 2,3-dioxygenase